MHKSDKPLLIDNDPTASERKNDHINLALQSQVNHIDTRFYYEPLLSAHPSISEWGAFTFLNRTLKNPLWVSSMTGGTGKAATINNNLARACGEFGMGMGLGSCRSLLYSDDTLADFNVRHLMGSDTPLYANLGIGQLENLIETHKTHLINELVSKLQADGLIIHVNPLQEWLQPEGDRFKFSPLQTIETILEKTKLKIIVKEVGQGFGYESLKALYQLDIEAVDFAAAGGTNFAKLELLRGTELNQHVFSPFANVGHTALEMVDMSNTIFKELGNKVRCNQVIISGGIQNFLDGYYLTSKINTNAVYGQASGFLKHAMGTYDELRQYVFAQIQGLVMAKAMLNVK
ncbi:MAG: isopentenyl-diphosphate delta-isomerase [Saprospiraceae bacterium]